MGAKISSVYLQYETDAGWSKAIYATLKDSKAIAFDGLDDEVFHEGKESRLHITYKLPRTVQVAVSYTHLDVYKRQQPM